MITFNQKTWYNDLIEGNKKEIATQEADSLQGSNHFWVVLLEEKLTLSGHQKNALLFPST